MWPPSLPAPCIHKCVLCISISILALQIGSPAPFLQIPPAIISNNSTLTLYDVSLEVLSGFLYTKNQTPRQSAESKGRA